MLKYFSIAKKKESKLISGLYMAEGEIVGGGRKLFLLVTIGAPAEYVDVYIRSEHTSRHSVQREHTRTHRPYVHDFRSFVFSCIFIKLLTGLF